MTSIQSIQMMRGCYWIVLLGTFLGVAIWESRRPMRSLNCRESTRWPCHLVLLFSQSMLVFGLLRWSGPLLTSVAFAESRFGILNRASLPFAVRCLLAVIALDFIRFAIHRVYHAVPVLWRLHQVHHSDPDYDVTTSGRHHPVESALSIGVQMAAIALLSPPVAIIFVWQLLSTFQSLFAHANATLPPRAERLLRLFVYTPDLHRIHHSQDVSDQGRNFGELFPWWDRLFGCYLGSPAAGRERIVTGLKDFPNERGADLLYLLMLPFRSQRAPADVQGSRG